MCTLLPLQLLGQRPRDEKSMSYEPINAAGRQLVAGATVGCGRDVGCRRGADDVAMADTEVLTTKLAPTYPCASMP
jgi:hypothetical protein